MCWCSAAFFPERVLLEGMSTSRRKKKKRSFAYIQYIRWHSKPKPWRPLLAKALAGVRRSFDRVTTQWLGSNSSSLTLFFSSVLTAWPLWVNGSNGKSKEPWPGNGANPEKHIYKSLNLEHCIVHSMQIILLHYRCALKVNYSDPLFHIHPQWILTSR